jgi:hypothetical protein
LSRGHETAPYLLTGPGSRHGLGAQPGIYGRCGSLQWLPARVMSVLPRWHTQPAVRPLPKKAQTTPATSTARHGPYFSVRVRVRPERRRAQSCAIALRSPAPERSQDSTRSFYEVADPSRPLCPKTGVDRPTFDLSEWRRGARDRPTFSSRQLLRPLRREVAGRGKKGRRGLGERKHFRRYLIFVWRRGQVAWRGYFKSGGTVRMTLVYYETMNECESAAIDRPTRRGPHRCAQKTARPTVFSCELVADYTSRVSKGSGRRPYGSEAEPMARGEPKSPCRPTNTS